MRNIERQIAILDAIKDEVEAENAAYRRRERQEERVLETPCALCGDKGFRNLRPRVIEGIGERALCWRCNEIVDLAGLLEFAAETARALSPKHLTGNPLLDQARILYDAGVRPVDQEDS